MGETDKPASIRLADATGLPTSFVGGKAASLGQLHRAGFRVPDADILTVAFFAPWIEILTNGAAWRDVVAALDHAALPDPSELHRLCQIVTAQAVDVGISDEQHRTLDAIAAHIGEGPLAVRSSSPEEDLAGASFAGLYESVLNVAAADLAGAITRCFASCFDARVVAYKVRRGIAPAPRFAAIVQRQIASEASGVAFSLNPHNNDFDEAVVNATPGFGDDLVAGAINPDQWVIDKVSGRILESRTGAAKNGEPRATVCLDPARVGTVRSRLCEVEMLFGKPVDVEWAFADDELHLLQARPITTYVPLPRAIQTDPGNQRLLYLDPSLGEGITMSGPVSPLTVDLFANLIRWLGDHVFGRSFLGPDLKRGIVDAAGARIYANASHLMLFQNLRRSAAQKRFVDTTMADLFATADLEPYRVKAPSNLAPRRVISAVSRAFIRLGPFLFAILRAVMRPKAFLPRYRRELAAFEADVASVDPETPIVELARRLYAAVGRVSLTASAPAMLVFIYGGTEALMGVIDQSSARHRCLAMDIRGGGEELVLEMGLAMYRLARLIPATALADLDVLIRRIKARRMPEDFLAQWDEFQHRFGCRGPLEMDLANPKYGDDPRLLVRQLAMLATGDNDPVATHARRKEARHAAFAELSAELPPGRRRKLARIYRTIEAFENVRELPKHHFTVANMVLRRRILDIADRAVATGRLDRIQDIFQTTLADVARAESDPTFDLRPVVAEHGAFYRDVKTRVRHFPHLIDSRGRILRPQGDHRPGELTGVAVSPGVVRGPAKVLDSPFEKTLAPGEVLVAHTTDPGWTPLFINAAAVLLEVGGELQHGALLAREYGKPCVAGIVGLMDALHDGQSVEVDGDRGIVRIASESSAAGNASPGATKARTS